MDLARLPGRDDPGHKGPCGILGDYRGVHRCLCNPDFRLSESAASAGPAVSVAMPVSGEPLHRCLSPHGVVGLVTITGAA